MSFLTGCSDSDNSGIIDGAQTQTAPKITAGGKTVELAQSGYSTAVPEDYFSSIDRSGTVQMIEYESRDYARDESEITKTAYVYLPYGYDENDTDTRYDICYLMHGWGGHAGEYFEYADIKEMLDNMIANGDIAPTIFVSATFYNRNSDTGFSGSVDELHAFYKDFENHLMPAVEGQFHTYAESTSYDDLKASRNHRAFGGFSLGSVTTWLQLCYNSDYIRYYLPMSGSCWYYGGYGDFQIEKNVDFIEQLVKDNELNERGYFIYHGVGTNDTVKSQSEDMAAEMLSRSDLFTPEHYVFYQREGGQHDHISCREFMYNALPLFFEDGDNKVSAAKTSADVTLDTTVGEVKRIAAFDDFGRLLFPVDRAVSDNMSLEDITSSNTYVWYNYLDPDKTVEIVNDLKNRSESGQQIFYSIYSEEEIARQTGADLTEIIPEIPYDSNRDNYNALAAYAKKEHDEDMRPAIKNDINIADYDTIFIGYPMWWYTFPMIIYTLFDKYDFSGKTIIPFNTHMGSHDGGTYDTIRELEPNATVVMNGLPVEMKTAETGAAKQVEKWLKSLNI